MNLNVKFVYVVALFALVALVSQPAFASPGGSDKVVKKLAGEYRKLKRQEAKLEQLHTKYQLTAAQKQALEDALARQGISDDNDGDGSLDHFGDPDSCDIDSDDDGISDGDDSDADGNGQDDESGADD